MVLTWLKIKTLILFLMMKNYIIEIFGDYYHDENRRKLFYSRTYNGTIQYYKEKGYKILIIWEKELKDIGSVLNKTRAFIGELK